MILACLTSINAAPVEQLALLQEGQTGARLCVSDRVECARCRARRDAGPDPSVARAPRANRSLWTMAPLGAILAVTVVMSELPYRIIWQSKSERIAFEGERCYVLGESEQRVVDLLPRQNAAAEPGRQDATIRRYDGPASSRASFHTPARAGRMRCAMKKLLVVCRACRAGDRGCAGAGPRQHRLVGLPRGDERSGTIRQARAARHLHHRHGVACRVDSADSDASAGRRLAVDIREQPGLRARSDENRREASHRFFRGPARRHVD